MTASRLEPDFLLTRDKLQLIWPNLHQRIVMCQVAMLHQLQEVQSAVTLLMMESC